MGGVLSLLYAALHTPGPIRNLACFTTPFDWSKFGLFNAWSDKRYFDVDTMVDSFGNMPRRDARRLVRHAAPRDQARRDRSSFGTTSGTTSS